jgi:hypothetical protein
MRPHTSGLTAIGRTVLERSFDEIAGAEAKLCPLRHVWRLLPVGSSRPSWEFRRPASGANEAGFVGDYHGLGAVSQAQFAENAGHVGLDRMLAQEQFSGNLGFESPVPW